LGSAETVGLIEHLPSAVEEPDVRVLVVRIWTALPENVRRVCAEKSSTHWYEAVMAAAESERPEHRAAAAAAAVELPGAGFDRIVPALLPDRERAVSDAAVGALAAVLQPSRQTSETWPRACAALAAAADAIDRHRRREVAELLVQTWAEPVLRHAATDALRAIMADASHPVHFAARGVLRRLPDDRVELAVRHLTTPPWSAAARTRVRAAGPDASRRVPQHLLLHPVRAAACGDAVRSVSRPRPAVRASDPWGESAASRVLARRMLRAQPGGIIEEAKRRLRSDDPAEACRAALWAQRAGAARDLAPALVELALRASREPVGERAAAAATVALRDADDGASVDALRSLLGHADPRIVSSALEALARRAVRAGAWHAVRSDVARVLDDQRHRVRATAIVLMGRIEPEAARAALLRMLGDPLAMHRVAAVWAASRLVGSGALRPDARLWAALALLAESDRYRAIRERAAAATNAIPPVWPTARSAVQVRRETAAAPQSL
jgi:hypothetical protein